MMRRNRIGAEGSETLGGLLDAQALVDVRAEPLKDGLVGETRCALKGQGCGYG